MRWYRLAADQKHATARHHLGVCYANGEGVAQDDAEAFRWYQLAAEQGHFGAQLDLARSYLEGFGVSQDYELAHIWANRAVGQAPRDSREAAITLRDQAEAHFSSAEILALQQRAREWTQATGSATAPRPQNAENTVPVLDAQPFQPSLTDSATLDPRTAPAVVSGVYAGFWWRTLALVVDAVIVNVAAGVIAFIGGIGIGAVLSGRPDAAAEAGAVLGFVVGILTSWLYFTLCESSTWQATLGKRWLHLVVTDLTGRRIGFGQANGRYWGKLLSGLLLFIGFLMVGFDRKKQGLHDKMAGTLVVRVPAS